MKPDYQIHFQSPRFKPVPGEESETNPRCVGKELAQWLCEEFKNKGYSGAELIPEDFGWCVMCSREGCLQWIGCGSVLLSKENDEEREGAWLADEVVWTAFPVAEIPFYNLIGLIRRLTGKIKLDGKQAELGRELRKVLDDAEFIAFCESP